MENLKPELITKSDLNISCNVYREVMDKVMRRIMDYAQKTTGLMTIETPSTKINPLAYRVPILVRTLIATVRNEKVVFYKATIALHSDHTLEISVTDNEEKDTKLFIQIYCNNEKNKVSIERRYFNDIEEAERIEREMGIVSDNYTVITRITGKMLMSIILDIESRIERREENEEEKLRREIDSMLRCYL